MCPSGGQMIFVNVKSIKWRKPPYSANTFQAEVAIKKLYLSLNRFDEVSCTTFFDNDAGVFQLTCPVEADSGKAERDLYLCG